MGLVNHQDQGGPVFLVNLAGLEDLSLLYVLLDHQNQGDHLCLDHQEHQLDLAIPVVLAIRVALSTQAVLEDLGDQGHL